MSFDEPLDAQEPVLGRRDGFRGEVLVELLVPTEGDEEQRQAVGDAAELAVGALEDLPEARVDGQEAAGLVG